MKNSSGAITLPEDMVTISKVEYDQFLNQETEIALLKHQLAELKRMIFGSKSERFVPEATDQLRLNLDTASEESAVETPQEITYTRNKTKNKDKKKPVRLPIPAHIPREDVHIYPQEDVSRAKKIGELITEVLNYKPGTLYVKRYIRHKYVLTEGAAELQPIVVGSLPSLPIPCGNADASLIAYIIVSKYVDHLPFYRLSKMFKRQGVYLAESTLNDWFSAGSRLLEPLYEVLKSNVQKVDYLMADETGIPVLTKDKPGATHKGCFFVYYDPITKQVCFDYQTNRSREGPKAFLEPFKGTLQTDGYLVYSDIEKLGKKKTEMTLLACMAHARRKFESALENNRALAEPALYGFQRLYRIERIAHEKGLSHQNRYLLRQKHAVPVLEAMEKELKAHKEKVTPKSPIGKAIAYTLRLWPRLESYVLDGKYEIDNNPIENSIRPVALGRKNYMFAGSHKAAQRAAIMYSFLGTCKMHDVEPWAWMTDVLNRISDCKTSQLHELLPQNWSPIAK